MNRQPEDYYSGYHKSDNNLIKPHKITQVITRERNKKLSNKQNNTMSGKKHGIAVFDDGMLHCTYRWIVNEMRSTVFYHLNRYDILSTGSLKIWNWNSKMLSFR